jgi:hypothetical protein
MPSAAEHPPCLRDGMLGEMMRGRRAVRHVPFIISPIWIYALAWIKTSPPGRQERLTAAALAQSRTRPHGLGRASDLFHTLFDLLSGVVGHF